jgi:hypothetical protein
MHYIAYDPALFINGKRSVAESDTEDRKYLCRFHPCNEIIKCLYEIFEAGKKQDLTPSLLYPQAENVLFLTKWGLAPFILGQKQCVFEPYSLSLSSMVAVTISQNLCSEHSNQLSRKWRCLFISPFSVPLFLDNPPSL